MRIEMVIIGTPDDVYNSESEFNGKVYKKTCYEFRAKEKLNRPSEIYTVRVPFGFDVKRDKEGVITIKGLFKGKIISNGAYETRVFELVEVQQNLNSAQA